MREREARKEKEWKLNTREKVKKSEEGEGIKTNLKEGEKEK